MAYSCKDCSYRGKVSGQVGECPACGSFNIVKQQVQREQEPTPAKWRLIAVIVLWAILIVMITWKLIN